ncbi:hypothetical protein TNCV_2021291 [Trichonephila clavipes]|nr:hypothetical protein TNCV_2021291 [Trichonephila clavipes]
MQNAGGAKGGNAGRKTGRLYAINQEKTNCGPIRSASLSSFQALDAEDLRAPLALSDLRRGSRIRISQEYLSSSRLRASGRAPQKTSE